MVTRDELPEDWIPLIERDNPSDNVTGGIFLNPSGSNLTIIQVREGGENEVISLYEHQATGLIHRLIDYIDDNAK